jgi:urease accessory protein UreE
VANVVPTDVFVARLATIADMGKLALELGNLHAPVQIADDALITLADGPAEEVLDRLAIPFSRCDHRFEPTPIVAAVGFADEFRIFEG